MKLSRYIKCFPSDSSASTYLLFSAKNAAIAAVPHSLLRLIRKEAPVPEADERLLRRLGMLVADPERERRQMLKYVDDVNRLNRVLNIKLVMNLDCNLACRYCFEGTRKGKHYLSETTADAFVSFVRSAIKKADDSGRSFEKISLTFYGGEPLLSKKMIITISRQLNAIAETSGIDFSFSLMTNGTLLTKSVALEMKNLGLKEACLTLDGLRDNHDAYRPFKGGGGTFDIIFRNMQAVTGIVKIDLGGNYTETNYCRFPELLDLLMEKGLTPSKIAKMGFYPVLSESAPIMPDFHEGCVSLNEPWLADAGLFLREEILKRGYSTGRIMPSVCMIEQPHNMVVNYNGDIYKCPGLIGRQEFKAGDIWQGTEDCHASHGLDNWKNEKCLACEYLPLCFGGCRYMKLVRDGSMNGVDCRKPYLDATLEPAVLQDIRYGLVS